MKAGSAAVSFDATAAPRRTQATRTRERRAATSHAANSKPTTTSLWACPAPSIHSTGLSATAAKAAGPGPSGREHSRRTSASVPAVAATAKSFATASAAGRRAASAAAGHQKKSCSGPYTQGASRQRGPMNGRKLVPARPGGGSVKGSGVGLERSSA